MTLPDGDIKHCRLHEKAFDPYQLIQSKSMRIGWNQLSDASAQGEKRALVNWFSMLRDYSDELTRKIIVKGVLDSEFNNITFILNLVHEKEFENMESATVYRLLHDFVCEAPESICAWIDEKDYSMSRDILALLSKVE